jgi:SAM-dependent methyltransferase
MEREGTWWDGFFEDRDRPVPFLTSAPDENLPRWFAAGRVRPGRVLDLGCGPGRNAVWLARQGCAVTGVDFSAGALERAREQAAAAGVDVDFRFGSIFDADLDADLGAGGYDLVYDSGCLHHLAPAHRAPYRDLVTRALRPGGQYGLVCFRPEGGSGLSDEQAEAQGSIGGGLGYTAERLRELWDTPPFAVLELEQMPQLPHESPMFGADFLWALLAVRTA